MATAPELVPSTAQVHVVSGRRLFSELMCSALGQYSVVLTRPERSSPPLARRGDVVVIDGAQRDRESAPLIGQIYRGQGAQVLVVLAGNDPLVAAHWIEAGAHAILTEDVSLGELHDAVARLAQGEVEARQRLWRYVIATVALLLLAETFVANSGWRGTSSKLTVEPSEGSAS